MKKLSLMALLTVSLTTISVGQEFKVPEHYRLEAKEDYKPYEADVIACIDYLCKTPIDDKSELTKKANAFLLKWITGSPYVHIKVEPYLSKLTKKNPGLLMIFLGGWTKHALQNPDKVNDLSGNLAGLRSLIKVHGSGKGVKKNKEISRLEKLDEEGKLEAWLKERIHKK